MRLTTIISALAATLAAVSCSSQEYISEAFSPEHILWYDEPASIWEETLPLGNGRLGMMPDGGIEEERIVLNEISMWSGSEADYANPDAAESLPEIRALLLEGKNAEAQEVMYQRFVPHKPTDGGTYGGYQTLGDLHIDYHYGTDNPGFCGIQMQKLNPSHSCGVGPSRVKPSAFPPSHLGKSNEFVCTRFVVGSQGHGRPWFQNMQCCCFFACTRSYNRLRQQACSSSENRRLR